ncbi:DUF4038 domain-containing protein [Acidobacteria bacterium AH-259-O06]|nr:DUF4038 domain-containing protein [Acidobacteria bacterium AH-259-O06]
MMKGLAMAGEPARRLLISILVGLISFQAVLAAVDQVGIWMKFEQSFTSDKDYENPLYNVSQFSVHFRSPTARLKKISGFWDGGRTWKVRFAPDEKGTWSYRTECSDTSNSGLHEQTGSFEVVEHASPHALYRRGSIVRPKGRYYLTYSDGTPFFWTADTAWNGALKSTAEEWRRYLKDRLDKGYNAIQLVTTQWRGGDRDRQGRVAFEGAGRIRIHPEFFQRLDRKMDLVNEYGLVAAPVLLWTLQFGQGRHLSPGYYLPENEAILLARYLVARYGGHQVIWFLGGDGRYVDEYEQRWKNIGQSVFGEEHPGIVAQHPHGRSWIGNAYAEEDWLDIVGYQSSHSKAQRTVDWINRGPVAAQWHRIPAKPIINLEPLYEEIHQNVTARDVRQACYWSVFATPPAGISYGANGIWPWLRGGGGKILNHRDAPWTSPWHRSLALSGARQVGYLSKFIQSFEWWRLRPVHSELLVEQPGDQVFNHFVPALATDDQSTVLVYFPVRTTVRLRNRFGLDYEVRWFDPLQNRYLEEPGTPPGAILEFTPPAEQDFVLVLQQR